MDWIEVIYLIMLLLLIAISICAIFASQKLSNEQLIHKLKIEELQNSIQLYKRSRASYQEVASKALLGEACLLMALKERSKNGVVAGYKYATEWLQKRQELLNELDKEFEAQGHENLDEVYDSTLRITGMIYSGELDIKRN